MVLHFTFGYFLDPYSRQRSVNHFFYLFDLTVNRWLGFKFLHYSIQYKTKFFSYSTIIRYKKRGGNVHNYVECISAVDRGRGCWELILPG